MKLTWFGGTTIRIHIGGAILVCDPDGAPDGIDRAELVSGADQVFGSGGGLDIVDAGSWKPRQPARVIDEDGGLEGVLVRSVGDGVVLIDAVGEPPLLLANGTLPRLDRWAGDAVVVLFGDGRLMGERGAALLDATTPRLIALAGQEADIDLAIDALREHLVGTGLLALETSLALEV